MKYFRNYFGLYIGRKRKRGEVGDEDEEEEIVKRRKTFGNVSLILHSILHT